MKKRKFNAKTMRKFTTEPKVVHEAKPIDLITQYNRMRSIATDIYNSDFYMIAAKAEQKKIEASIACISATMISMIGMEAIENSHDCLPDDSGNGNDRSWDNLPDDSGDYTDTDKASHDAIEKLKNIAYGKTESDGVKKAAARQVLNSVYGATHPIMAMNRKILSELGTKSPTQIMDECRTHTDNEHDDDSDGDEVKKFEVNLGNFIDGPFYSDQYRALAIQYGFDIEPTLKQIEKLASYYYIQMINLVDVVDSQDEITADKYTLEPGSVFFITNKKDSSKSPVFILVYMQPYTKTRSFDISRFSIEIAPAEVEESTKTNYVELIDPDFYFHIGRANPNNAIDLNATLDKIKDEARTCGISSITFAGTLEYGLDIYDGKYSLKPGSLFYINDGPNMTNFLLVTEVGDTQNATRVQFIESIMKPKDEKLTNLEELEESTKTNDVDFGNFADGPFYSDKYRHICQLYGFNIDETLKRIVKTASDYTISKLNLVGVVSDKHDIKSDDKYYPNTGDVFFVTNKENDKDPVFVLIYTKSYLELFVFDIDNVGVEIKPVDLEESTKTNYIDFVGSDAYYNIGKVHLNPNIIINLDATLAKIKDEARAHGVDTITFVDTIGNSLDILTEGKYTLEPGSLFYLCGRGNCWLNFMLIVKDEDTPDKVRVCFINPVGKPEDASLDDIEFIGINDYYKIDKAYRNSDQAIIDLDATLIKIKEKAKKKGLKTITFVGTIKEHSDIYTKGKYSLEPGSLFIEEGYSRFILINETPTTFYYIDPVVVFKTDDSDEDSSDSNKDGSHDVVDTEVKFEYTPYESRYINDLATSFMAKDDIEFVGIDAYYSISKVHSNSNDVIDLDATLSAIKVKAKEFGIKTVTFVDTITDNLLAHFNGEYSMEVGSLFCVKDDDWAHFLLITKSGNLMSDIRVQYIYPVMTKKDDSEDESDSKEDGIEVVEAEDEIVDSDEASSDHCINDQYADVDTSKLNHDIYAGVSFPIFMKPTESGKYVSFVDICDIYNFDVSETIKRIKNVVYQENIGSIKYVDTIWSCDEIFRKDENDRYVYGNGSLFLMVNYTNAGKDPYFVILRKMWDDHVSEYVSTLYRINPVMKSAKINNVKEIKVIDDYADGNVRITKDLKNIISIEYDYKIKEICEKRNYDYEKMISCLRGVTAIIGGGTYLTFEGSVDSLNSIVSVDPVVAYKTCSVFFVSGFVDSEKGPYFVIYMPTTGKTKNGYNFHLYRIYPILNLNQDSNTDSQDDSNVREINQFTTIYRANLEVSEADKDAYMKVEFSNIDRNDGEIQSLANICYTWKFKFYDTIKRIRFVAYMSNFEEIKYAGTACSHEEILEKEVLYSNGSALFVSDEEDPHFVIVEFINRSTRLIRINPVKE